MSRRASFPAALLAAFGLTAALTLASWLGARVHFATAGRTVLILGDSRLGNYRMAPGERFEESLQAELGPGWVARNFAAPGASTGDFYLLYRKARLLGIRPDLVVIGLSPQKLAASSARGPRYDNDGENLRWLPLDAEGSAFFQTLGSRYQSVAAVQKIGLLFGFYDGLRDLWVERVQWPAERERMRREDGPQRQAAIFDHARKIGEGWARNELVLSDPDLAASREATDLDFLLRALRAAGIRAVVLVLPEAHVGIAPRAFPPAARTRLDFVYQQMLAWCRRHGAPVVDFNASGQRERFGPEEWDDVFHLKSAASFRRMAQGIREWSMGD